MKKKIIFPGLKLLFIVSALAIGSSLLAQTKKDKRLISDANDAKTEFINVDGQMNSLFANAYGYVIFPNVGKGGIGIGGAAGNGIVYEKGAVIGKASLTQISIGFQWGGQVYREVIFFESASDLNRFKQNNIEFSAQASAVAVTAGASANVKYADGVMIFSQIKGGLMYEASVGGQKFRYTSF